MSDFRREARVLDWIVFVLLWGIPTLIFVAWLLSLLWGSV